MRTRTTRDGHVINVTLTLNSREMDMWQLIIRNMEFKGGLEKLLVNNMLEGLETALEDYKDDYLQEDDEDE